MCARSRGVGLGRGGFALMIAVRVQAARGGRRPARGRQGGPSAGGARRAYGARGRARGLGASRRGARPQERSGTDLTASRQTRARLDLNSADADGSTALQVRDRARNRPTDARAYAPLCSAAQLAVSGRQLAFAAQLLDMGAAAAVPNAAGRTAVDALAALEASAETASLLSAVLRRLAGEAEAAAALGAALQLARARRVDLDALSEVRAEPECAAHP
jgi:hypothetical protein